MTAVAVPAHVAVLAPYVEAGVLDAGEVQLCAAFARLVPGLPGDVLVGLAVAARGPGRGHVCIELADAARLVVDRDEEVADGLPWPEPAAWERSLLGSDVVARPTDYLTPPLRPLVWDGHRLYLQRFFHYETVVADDLSRRAALGPALGAGERPAEREDILGALFPARDPSDPNLQRQAAAAALAGHVTVLAGGPGTGKTRTIARLLAAAHQLAAARGEDIEVALAAPTGKAAGRMTAAVHAAVAEAERDGLLDPSVAERLLETAAMTLHRLLGARPGAGFSRHAGNPLPYDLVIVDETSMVSLALMAHLLGAVRPDARLVLVGDPFQLASIDAGSVMSDIVGPGAAPARPTDPTRFPLAGRVTVLTESHRFGEDSTIAALAAAVRTGDADGALHILAGDAPGVTWLRDTDQRGIDHLLDEVVAAALDVVRAATADDIEAGLTALRRVKVLAATRHRPFGLADWTDRIEARLQRAVPTVRTAGRWYVGRPVIVTANDHPNRLTNGDVGLTVRHGEAHAVAFEHAPEPRLVPPSQLDRIETWWAMTIHRSQGSEFPHAVVSLPPGSSPILSRELLYTAVTRARHQVTVVGGEEVIRAAIAQPVRRASGLRDRLWPGV